MPEFAVHLTTDTAAPTSDDAYDDLLDDLVDVHGVVSVIDGRLALRVTVDADDIVGAVRAGHAVACRALLIIGRVGTVVAVEAQTAEEFDREQGPPFAAELADAPRHHLEPQQGP